MIDAASASRGRWTTVPLDKLLGVSLMPNNDPNEPKGFAPLPVPSALVLDLSSCSDPGPFSHPAPAPAPNKPNEDGDSAGVGAWLVLHDAVCEMADGVPLATDLYLPCCRGVFEPTRRFPTVLVRTPYDKHIGALPLASFWCIWGYITLNSIPSTRIRCPRGFALVLQDCRGRFKSAGKFKKYPPDTILITVKT
jgi:hypothetical protein